MTTHEVRFRGRLIEHFAEDAAHAYVRGRCEHPIEGPAFQTQDWTVAPRRPVELHGRGNLIDTFETVSEAEQVQSALLADFEARHGRRFQRHPVDLASVFVITDTRTTRETPVVPITSDRTE